MDVAYVGEGIISGYIGSRKFRPSAWSEMLCDCAATFHPSTKILEYADYLRPIYSEQYGHCVDVNFDELKQANPVAYEHVLWFIRSNHLQVFSLEGNELVPFSDSQGEAA